MKTKIITLIAAIFLFAAILSCATQIAPGGGPEDKAPPEVAGTLPENGQTNVDLRTSVTVTFNEWISTSGAASAVSVYPRVEGGINVKAKKNRITITPAASFKDNTTYHVVIGTALRDLRNNAIMRPINIVFSTGPELDKGKIEGKVVSLKKLASLPRVALYREGAEWKDTDYFSPPDYMTECDSGGVFSFSNLREGRYRVIGFDDNYRLRRLRMGDTCFTSLEQSVHITGVAQRIRLYPAFSDTAAVADSVGVDTSKTDTSKMDAVIADTVKVDTSKMDAVVADTARVDTSKMDVVIADTARVDTSKMDVVVADTAKVDTSKKAEPSKVSICYRLSGGADCLEPNNKRKWVFMPQGKTEGFTVRDSAGTFSFDSIPASKGTLIWFIDDNGDDLITFGKLVPWRAPERFFVVSEQIDAKANWEVVDLRVEACEEELDAGKKESGAKSEGLEADGEKKDGGDE